KRVQAELTNIPMPWLGFVRKQLCDQHCVDSSLFSLACQAVFAEFQQLIEIAKEHHWRVDVLLCMSNAYERVAKSNAVAQRAFRRALNHLTIGNWIAERDAELDDICSSLRKFD